MLVKDLSGLTRPDSPTSWGSWTRNPPLDLRSKGRGVRVKPVWLVEDSEPRPNSWYKILVTK